MTPEYNWGKGIVGPSLPVPPIPAEYQPIIDKGDLDALETLVMGKIDAAAGDIPWYVPAYKVLVKKKETARAEVLLQLQMETLREKNEISSETDLCSAVLGFWPDCSQARDGLLFHLKKMYFDSPGFERIAAHCAVLLSPGLDTLRLFEAWLRYDEGRCVYMPTRGAGRVKEVNLALGVLRVAFENGPHMSFKIDEAQRLCQSLPREHFLTKKLNAPAELQKLAAEAPGDLLAFLFASVNRPLALAELREMLAGVVPDAGWSGWWAKARKDPRITVGEGTRAQITWSDSADLAASAIAGVFAKAAPADKPDLMRKHAARSPALAAIMRDGIIADANAALAGDPSLALELALQLESLPAAGTGALAFSPASLAGRPDCAAIVAGVQDRLSRKKAMRLIPEARSDWPEVYLALARAETDTQALASIYDALRDKGQSALLEKAVSSAISDPASAPHFYVWLCREMPARPELKARANAEFLFALLRILDNKAFKGYHAALRKLFDLGEAADWAATTLGSDEATRVLEALNHETGLEDYRKDRLRQEIYHLHPELQEKKATLVYVTGEALEAKKKELEKLVRVDIPQNSLEIKRTREYGDLRENFEYHAARARQEMLSSRAQSLHDELVDTRAIDFNTVETSKATIGTRIYLRDSADNRTAIGLLGPWDSDPSKNILSYTSVAGKALLGSKTGEKVRVGETDYVVEKIEVWTSGPVT